MRLGKPVEHLQAALRAYQTKGIAAEQITTIGRQLAYFGYLSYDTFVWVRSQSRLYYNRYPYVVAFQANAVKFFNLAPSTADRVSRISNRFWLSGILLSITHGLLKASLIRYANMLTAEPKIPAGWKACQRSQAFAELSDVVRQGHVR